eukprot:GHRR01032043.1.p1 GENE.GHRR01032043.1~~GHRR01032043.1.p1  ORF type:complete len:109 (+),score=18.73 GHRR01032043.1:649-975(+)
MFCAFTVLTPIVCCIVSILTSRHCWPQSVALQLLCGLGWQQDCVNHMDDRLACLDVCSNHLGGVLITLNGSASNLVHLDPELVLRHGSQLLVILEVSSCEGLAINGMV